MARVLLTKASLVIAAVFAITVSSASAAPLDLYYQSQLRIDGPARGIGSVHSPGDIDGDGRDELVTSGQNSYLHGLIVPVHVVYGRDGYGYEHLDDPGASTLIDGLEWVSSIVSAGDVNGDGIGDMGITGRTTESEGATSWVVFGARERSDLDLRALGDRGFEIGPSPGREREYANDRPLAALGDVNGDGHDDIAVGRTPPGSTTAPTLHGTVYVILGSTRTSRVALTELGDRGFRIDGAGAGHELGWTLAGVGDVDGDGFTDLAAGAPGAEYAGTHSGSVYAVSLRGQTRDIDLGGDWHGFRVDGARGSYLGGYRLEGTGETDGDGLSDILIHRQIVRGSTSSATVTIGGPHPRVIPFEERAGPTAGDWNGDRLPEIVLANYNGFGPLTASVLSGDADQVDDTLFDAVLAVSTRSIGYGIPDSGGAFATTGDFNGDGRPDVAAGSPAFDPAGGLNTGAAFVVFGGVDPPRRGPCAQPVPGSGAPDRLRGTNSGDYIDAGPGADELLGLDGEDCLLGGDDTDHLDGSSGDDFLDGGAADDTILAGRGDDIVLPGPGIDLGDAGAGNDLFDTRDGAADTVLCGPGVDYAFADALDTVRDCEPYGPNVQASRASAGGRFYLRTPTESAIASDRTSGRSLVVWPQIDERDRSVPTFTGRVMTRVVDGRGLPVGAPRPVSDAFTLDVGAFDVVAKGAAVTPLAKERSFLVVWVQPQGDGRLRIMSRVIPLSGAPQSPPQVVAPTSGGAEQVSPALAAGRGGNRVLAVWSPARTAFGKVAAGGVRARLLEAGRPTGRVIRLRAEPTAVAPSVAAGAGGWLVSWSWPGTAVEARRVGTGGGLHGPVRHIARTRARECCDSTPEPAVVYQPIDRRFLVSWDTPDGDRIRGRITAADGQPVTRTHTLAEKPPGVDGDLRNLALAWGAQRFLLVASLADFGYGASGPGNDTVRAYWVSGTGRREQSREEPPSAGQDFASGGSVGFSSREGRFLIASIGQDASPPPARDELHAYVRSWPAAPPP